MILLLILFIYIAGIIGLLWAYHQYQYLTKIQTQRSLGMIEDDERQLQTLNITDIGHIIAEGANQFIYSQYKVCAGFILLMSVLIFGCVDSWESGYTTFSFILGAFTSMICGAFGMKIATFSNYRTTSSAKQSLAAAFKTSFKAGCVIGFTLVSISIMILLTLLLLYKMFMGLEDQSPNESYYENLFEVIAGFGLGGSTVALFARVGGGIFTKAADLGSDLVGKIQAGLPEDSPKNPATIADNVGDNVGDIAGMGADLFGSFAESTCAALVIGGNSVCSINNIFEFQNFLFILMIPAVGIIVCLITTWFLSQKVQVSQNRQVQSELKKQLIYSTVLLLPLLWFTSSSIIPSFKIISHDKQFVDKTSFDLFSCVAVGLVAGLIIGYFTETMTSYSYNPVIELANSCTTGPATNVIYGLSLGYFSTIIPVILLCFVCYYSHSTLGYFGVALSSLGMLSNLPICLTIDSYGPISDNAGGIAQMAGLNESVRQRTDVLDSAGNTTAAIGKGFAIGSATLVGFALYGGFLHRAYNTGSLKKGEMSFDDPMIFTFLLFGSMIPYAFSALTMKSVGKAALGMIQEVRRQIRVNPQILEGTAPPDYRACVRISTNSSLKEMILPGLLVTLTPFTLGILFGPRALIGFLPGAIVSGVQMAISASNTGGAWDNAKKYIQAGLMKDSEGNIIKKGSEQHKAAVIGDTVGDPLKDTSGPSLNILIKLMAILSLVFCKYFSNPILSN